MKIVRLLWPCVLGLAWFTQAAEVARPNSDCPGALELYSLSPDSRERTNRVPQESPRAGAMQARLTVWCQEVGVKMPGPNTKEKDQ